MWHLQKKIRLQAAAYPLDRQGHPVNQFG